VDEFKGGMNKVFGTVEEKNEREGERNQEATGEKNRQIPGKASGQGETTGFFTSADRRNGETKGGKI